MQDNERKCEKCDSEVSEYACVVEAGQSHILCRPCDAVLERFNGCCRLKNFLEDNLDLHPIDRSMIEARKFRNSGASLWREE